MKKYFNHFHFFCALCIHSVFFIAVAHAETSKGNAAPTSKTDLPEDEDFSTTPYTQYGEFNEDSEEASDTRFFQFGRFFGVSLGTGFQGVTGNRGSLWQGGFPAVDFKVHYWFDFNAALDLNIYFVSHRYDVAGSTPDSVNVSFNRLGLDFKYYFDTKNLSAPISFANPYLLLGAGSYSKAEYSTTSTETKSDNAFGVCFGGGLEFPIKYRKLYFTVEAKYHLPSFKDVGDAVFKSSNGIADLSGNFYTTIGSLLFVW